MARRPPPSLAEATARLHPTAIDPSSTDAAPAPVPIPRTSSRRPSREGKRGIAFWVSPEAFRAVGLLSWDMDRPIQSLMEEALDDLLRKYDKHPMARKPEDAA
jgi:hypothetical protein